MTTFEWFLIIISTSLKDHHPPDCQELIEHFISYLRTKKEYKLRNKAFPNILLIEVTEYKLNLNFGLLAHAIHLQEMRECGLKTKAGSLEKADGNSSG